MDGFHIYERIGAGVHSDVLKGRKKKTIEYYAIKSVQLSQKRVVHQEVRIIHGLDHPNILKFYNWYETQRHLWLILEYCVGGDLRSLLQQDTCLPESSVHDLGRDLLAATQYLHSEGIIHCDLKPTNVLLDENGTIKLGGFGCARRIQDIDHAKAGRLCPDSRGTPTYMAPELFHEGSTHSTASDLWSLGCILYECYQGRPPFAHDTFHELVQSILHAEPGPLHGASPEFTDLVLRLLDKNPATRMTWMEMLTHPFWKFSLYPLQLPEEAALARFIDANDLAPRTASISGNVSQSEGKQAAARAKMVRESINIRLLGLTPTEVSDRAGAASKLEDTDFDRMRTHLDVPVRSSGSLRGATDSVIEARRTDLAIHYTPNCKDAEGTNSAHCDSEPSSVTEIIKGLVFSRMDLVVRPLVGNRRIESWGDESFDDDSLPAGVAQWTSERVAKLRSNSDASFDSFLRTVSSVLQEVSRDADTKRNLLIFMETVASHEGAAQVFIDSAFSYLLVEVFQKEKGTALRMQAATVLGVLARYASNINRNLLLHAVDKLRGGLSDSHDGVRRRTMAALGELVFYLSSVDSNLDGSGASAQSQVLADCILDVVATDSDPVTQLYACKAVDNILAKDGFWADRFAAVRAPSGFLQVVRTSEHDAVQAVACSAFGRVLLRHPQLVPPVINTAADVLLPLLRDGEAKLKVAALNAINIMLVSTEPHQLISMVFVSEDVLMLDVIALVSDVGMHSRIRAKAMLTAALLIRISPKRFAAAVELKVLMQLPLSSHHDKQSQQEGGDQDMLWYMQACMEALSLSACSMLPRLVEQVMTALQRGYEGEAVVLLPAVVTVLRSQATRVRAVSQDVVIGICSLMDIIWVSDVCAGRAGCSVDRILEMGDLLQTALEALVQPQDVLLDMAELFVRIVLPCLCKVAHAALDNRGSQSSALWDARVNITRMLTELLMFYVARTDMYGESTVSIDASSLSQKDVTRVLDDLLAQEVALLLQRMVLHKFDPMPLYAQKLLATLLPRNARFVKHVAEEDIVRRFFEFLSIDSPNNNIHNIRVCRVLVASGTVHDHVLQELDIAGKVANVLEYAHENQVDAFLEPTVELCLSMLERERDLAVTSPHALGTPVSDAAATTGRSPILARNVLTHLSLCSQHGSTLSLLSADCLLLMARMYVVECSSDFLSGKGLSLLVLALQCSEGFHKSADSMPRILQCLLEALFLCGTVGKATASSPVVSELHGVVGVLVDHQHPAVRSWAQKVAAMFE